MPREQKKRERKEVWPQNIGGGYLANPVCEDTQQNRAGPPLQGSVFFTFSSVKCGPRNPDPRRRLGEKVLRLCEAETIFFQERIGYRRRHQTRWSCWLFWTFSFIFGSANTHPPRGRCVGFGAELHVSWRQLINNLFRLAIRMGGTHQSLFHQHSRSSRGYLAKRHSK